MDDPWPLACRRSPRGARSWRPVELLGRLGLEGAGLELWLYLVTTRRRLINWSSSWQGPRKLAAISCPYPPSVSGSKLNLRIWRPAKGSDGSCARRGPPCASVRSRARKDRRDDAPGRKGDCWSNRQAWRRPSGEIISGKSLAPRSRSIAETDRKNTLGPARFSVPGRADFWRRVVIVCRSVSPAGRVRPAPR